MISDWFFHMSNIIYEFGKRQRKYRLSNAHEIRKYFGNYQTTNSWTVLRFCFVRTAPFLNITTLRKSGPWYGYDNACSAPHFAVIYIAVAATDAVTFIYVQGKAHARVRGITRVPRALH